MIQVNNLEDSPALTLALKYLALGWSVIPIGHKSKIPLIEWKEFQTRRATEDEIRAWFTKWPDMNIGIVTGAISGIIGIDVDTYKGGNYPVIATATAATGGGGKHYFLKHPGTPVKNSEGELSQFVDVRGDGGYVVVPPSIHPSGNLYTWEIEPSYEAL